LSLEKITLPSTRTSKTPSFPAINLLSIDTAFLISAAARAASGR
jgi:hypothetical protein